MAALQGGRWFIAETSFEICVYILPNYMKMKRQNMKYVSKTISSFKKKIFHICTQVFFFIFLPNSSKKRKKRKKKQTYLVSSNTGKNL